jgi:outer membrane protein TolC
MMWGIRLQVPIFTSFKRSFQRQQAQLELQKVKNQQMQLNRQLQLQWQSSKKDYLNAYEQYQTQKENLALAKDIYHRTTVKYQEGVSSSTDLAQTEKDYLDTQRQYINALADLLNRKAHLQSVLEEYQ